MADADLLWEKITADWLVVDADLVWEKNTVDLLVADADSVWEKKITTGLLNDKPAEQSVYNQYGHEWEIKEWWWLFVELKSFTDIYRYPKTTCTCAYSSKQFNNLD